MEDCRQRRTLTSSDVPGDPLVSQVVDAIKTGGWNRDLATRIIAMVREHDAKDTAKVILDLCQALENHMDKRPYHTKNGDDAAWEAGCLWLGTNAANPTGGANG